MKENNSLKITIIISIVVVFVAILVSWTYMNLTSIETVNVNGQAELGVVSDLVTVYFVVQTDGNSSKEAKDENSKIVEEVIDSLVDSGFDKSDISTENFNVYENYDWTVEGRKFLGYRATHNLKVEMSSSDSEKIGKVVDVAVDNGAMLSYINFELSSELKNEYTSQVTLLATENARNKAQAMADGLRMKLGRVVSISDSAVNYCPYRVYDSSVMNSESMDGGAAVPSYDTDIQPGEQKIYGTVSVVYKLN